MESFNFHEWPVELRRKSFRRSVSIVLRPGKPIRVHAARMTSLKTVLDFLESRKDWIEKHLTHFEKQSASLPSEKWEAGEEFPFLGIQRKLQYVRTPTDKIFASISEEKLSVHVPLKMEMPPPREVVRRVVRDLYRREAVKHVTNRTAYWVELTGLAPSRVSVREARSRWGSCNRAGNISLNWRLMVYSPDVIDYVIVHELSHLRHMNHSASFWSLVESIYPEAKARSKEIKSKHRWSDFLEVRKDAEPASPATSKPTAFRNNQSSPQQ